MEELEEQLGAILGDSEAMGKIMALAQSLTGGGGEVSDTPPLREERDARLLSALRPYLRPERQRSLDRGLEILRLLRLMKGGGEAP